MFLLELTQLINSNLKINYIFKQSNSHFINWMAGSISNFTHIDAGVLNGAVTTVYNCSFSPHNHVNSRKHEIPFGGSHNSRKKIWSRIA